jgi:hypothetical protein
MTQTATRSSAKATAPRKLRTLTHEVGRGGKHILDRLATMRVARLQAEREEKPVKEQWEGIWKPLAHDADLQQGDVLVITALGVPRGRVTMRSRGKVVDLDLLLTAYPEAYSACVSENESAQFDPA